MDLMQKLSETKVDTSLFRSTKTMGAAKESKREQMRRALLEERFGINMEENTKILYEERQIREPEELEAEELQKSTKGTTGAIQEKANVVEEAGQVAIEVPKITNITVGSGLKRPLESDANGQPIIKKIKKSREAREERLMAMIEAMEREKEQESGSSMDEDEDDEEVEGGSSEGDSYGEGEEWGGIADSPVAGDVGKAEAGNAIMGTGGGATPSGGSSSSSGEEDEDESEGESEGDEGDGGGSEDGDDDDEEQENESVPRMKRGRSEKANAFKEWALAQRRQVLNEGDPSGADTSMPDLLALKPKVVHVHVPRKREEDMTPPPELQVPIVERKVFSNQSTTKGGGFRMLKQAPRRIS